MNQGELTRLLKLRYAAPEYAFLPQVRNSTGINGSVRTADALVMSLWPSRGIALHGFEIKSHRSDWLGELKNPSKAEAVCQFCDYWWIVTGEKEIVKLDEVPELWGLLVVRGKGLVAIKPAVKLTPQPISRVFLAGMLRRAADAIVPKAEIAAELKNRWQEGYEEGKRHESRIAAHRKRELESLQRSVAEFQNKSGVLISSYQGRSMAETVKYVREGGIEGSGMKLRAYAEAARSIANNIDKVVAEIDQNHDITANS